MTSKRSGNASTTRTTFPPTDPVDPRMESPFLTEAKTAPDGGRSPRVEEVIVQDRRAEQQAVEAVEHAPVAGEQAPRVLHPRPALHQALHEVADDARTRDDDAE